MNSLILSVAILILGVAHSLMSARATTESNVRQLRQINNHFLNTSKNSNSGFTFNRNFWYDEKDLISGKDSRTRGSKKSRKDQNKDKEVDGSAFLDTTIEKIQLKKSLDALKEENARVVRNLNENHAKAVQALKNKYDTLLDDFKALRERNDRSGDLKEQIAKLEDEKKNLGWNLNKLVERNSELTAQLKATNENQSELTDLQAKLKVTTKESLDLKSDLIDAKSEISNLKKKLSETERDLRRKTDESIKSSAEINKSVHEMRFLKEKMGSIVSKFVDFMRESKECKVLKIRFESLKTENANLDSENRSLKEELVGVKDSLNKSSAQTPKDCQKEQSLITDLTFEITDLKKRLSVAENQASSFIEKGKSSIQELNRLEEKIADLQENILKTKNQEKDLLALKEENASLKNSGSDKTSQCEKRVASLANELSATKRQADELAVSEKNLRKLTDELQATIEQLKKQISALGAVSSKPDQSKEVNELQKRLEEVQAKLRTTEDALAKATRASPQTQTDILLQQIKDLQTTYIECRKSLNIYMMQDRIRKDNVVGLAQ